MLAGIPAPSTRGDPAAAVLVRAIGAPVDDCGDICFSESRRGSRQGHHDESDLPQGSAASTRVSVRPSSRRSRELRWLRAAVAFALALSLGRAMPPANVSPSGDVARRSRRRRWSISPASASSSATPRAASAGFGTVNVTAGGILTAAQIVPGIGGLGTGFVNVTGAGSTVNLTGGAAFNGLDIGSWGTGVVTVSNGGQIACASVAGVRVQHHRQRRRLDRNAGDQRRLGHGTGSTRGRRRARCSPASARPAPTPLRRSRSRTAERCRRTASARWRANSGQTGP